MHMLSVCLRVNSIRCKFNFSRDCLLKYYQDAVTMPGRYRRIAGFALDYARARHMRNLNHWKRILAKPSRPGRRKQRNARSCKRICIRIAYGGTRQEVHGNLSASWSERATRNLHFACKHAWTTHCRSGRIIICPERYLYTIFYIF